MKRKIQIYDENLWKNMRKIELTFKWHFSRIISYETI